MKQHRCWHGVRRFTAVGLLGTALALGGCDLGEFSTTTSVTLSGREVISYLVRSAIMTPLQTAIDGAVNNFFDDVEEGDG